MMLSNVSLVTFHYKSYGTFCLHEKRPIISRVDLPTTDIIEPIKTSPRLARTGFLL